MKKSFIFLIMLMSILTLGCAQSALSGTYSHNADYHITFSGNSFSGAWDSSTISGTYSISNNRITLNITGGKLSPRTWNWTIVNGNTLKDHDDDHWDKANTETISSVVIEIDDESV